MKKLRWVKWLLILGAGIYIGTLIGCVGSDTPRNPLDGGELKDKDAVWWRTPVYANTPKDENPWMAFVKDQPNEFDPWANDDLQRYSVSPVVVPGGTTVAPVRSEVTISPDEEVERALERNLQDYLREFYRKKQREQEQQQQQESEVF